MLAIMENCILSVVLADEVMRWTGNGQKLDRMRCSDLWAQRSDMSHDLGRDRISDFAWQTCRDSDELSHVVTYVGNAGCFRRRRFP